MLLVLILQFQGRQSVVNEILEKAYACRKGDIFKSMKQLLEALIELHAWQSPAKKNECK